MLFLHGYLSSSKSFIYQQSFFSRDFEVFMPDLKGFGENTNMLFPYTLDDYINEVKEYMYKQDIVFPHIVAHSFGGRIAIKLSALEPNIFDKVVLAGSAGLKPRFSVKKFIKRKEFNLLKAFLPKEKLQAFYSSDYQSLDETMKKSFIYIVSEYLDRYLERIQNKTLIINGSCDTETPVYMAKILNRKIKNSSLSIYKGAGHFAFIDKPMTFNMEVREFFLSK